MSSGVNIPLAQIYLVTSGSPHSECANCKSLFAQRENPHRNVVKKYFSDLFMILLVILSALAQSLEAFLVRIGDDIGVTNLLYCLANDIVFQITGS